MSFTGAIWPGSCKRLADDGHFDCGHVSARDVDLGDRPLILEARTEAPVASRAYRAVVIVASLGRPNEVGELIPRLQSQTVPPAAILLCVTAAADVPDDLSENVEVLISRPGLTVQRNVGLERAFELGAEIAIFFDDDYVPCRSAIDTFCRLFERDPTIVGVTGSLIADGIHGPGISSEDAARLVAEHEAAADPESPARVTATTGLYGCNMAVRMAAVGQRRFDERLPLYGWQEDIDFSRQLLPDGRLVHISTVTGVHRGVKRARSPGYQLGWAQVINPAYMVRKGTMPLGFALRLVGRNLLANHLKALAPEPWVDRRGRLAGNWAGLWDVLSGKGDPMRILEIRRG